MVFAGLTKYHKESYAEISPKLPEVSQEGRTILITGGSYGIGLATAKAFVATSAKRVIILGRRAEKINSAVAELENEAVSIGSPTVSEGRVCDVSNLESSASLWTLLRDEGIVVDVLVLNAAAVGAIKPLIEIGRDNILKDYDLNFRTNLDFTERLYRQEGKGAGGRKVWSPTGQDLHWLILCYVPHRLSSGFPLSQFTFGMWSRTARHTDPPRAQGP